MWVGHKFGYDFDTLARILRRTGFASITRSSYMRSKHTALRVDDSSAFAGYKYGHEYYSLFVEATR
jgi:hypothetical protein